MILLTIFGWAFFSFWSAIPAGIALNVSPVLVALTVTASYGCGALLVVVVGTPIRERIRRRHNLDNANRMVAAVQRAWGRYGMVGLALLAPMTVGSQVGAVIGLSFGAQPWRLVMALTFGAAAWGVLLTALVITGLAQL